MPKKKKKKSESLVSSSVQSLDRETRDCKMGCSTSANANAAILLVDLLLTIKQLDYEVEISIA